MYKLTTDNNNNNIRSCLATIANFYMAAQLKIVCAVLFFTHFFLFALLMALLFLAACCKLQFPVASFFK